MWVRRPLFDNDPIEPLERLDILLVGQYQLNGRTVFEFRVDRKGETQLTKPSLAEAFKEDALVISPLAGYAARSFRRILGPFYVCA